MKRLLNSFGILALIAFGFGLGIFFMLSRTESLVLNQDAVVSYVAQEDVSVSLKEDAGRYIDIRPADQAISTLFIFYPGGLVRPQAYEWLGVALAPLGVHTLIPEMPLDLAVLSANRADKLLELYSADKVLIGGHSLGGAMAARYALNHADALDALVLMGAFSAESDDLSSLDLETLVLAAEHDGLATISELQAGLPRLPNAQLVEIPGSVHSFFGRYGPQQNDGIPTVTRNQAEVDISTVLSAFIARLLVNP